MACIIFTSLVTFALTARHIILIYFLIFSIEKTYDQFPLGAKIVLTEVNEKKSFGNV